MTDRHDRRDRQPDGPRVPDLLEVLNEAPPAPDLTSSIMDRLGYRPMAPAEARRRSLRTWGSRLVMVVCAAAMIRAGLHLHASGSSARLPLGATHGPSLPAAIGQDLEDHRRRLDRTIDTIRSLAPRIVPAIDRELDLEIAPVDAPEIDLGIDEAIDRSALGPVRWL